MRRMGPKGVSMEKIYELTVLFHPDLEIDLDGALKKLDGIIKENKGEVVKQDNWGKRRLAYPIKKQDFAVYVMNEVKIAPENANKVQALLNITDEIIRYLMVEKDLNAPTGDKAVVVGDDEEPSARGEEE